MLRQVWLGLYFWYYLGHLSSFAWLMSILRMHFLNKVTGLVAKIFLRGTIIFSWFGVNVLLSKVFKFLIANQEVDSLFRGYERLGKIVGWVILSIIGIGLHNSGFEKSTPCMLSFFFLAFNCLCALFCIQPCTDFRVFEFLLGESLDRAFSHFGIDSCSSWVVLIACIVMFGQRYWLQPKQTNLSSSLEQIVIDPSPRHHNLPSQERVEIDEPQHQQVGQHPSRNSLTSLETEEIEIEQNEQPPSPNSLTSLETEEIEIEQNEQPPSPDNLPFPELDQPFKHKVSWVLTQLMAKIRRRSVDTIKRVKKARVHVPRFGVDDFIDNIERVKKVRVRVPSFSIERVKNSFSIERVKKARVHVPRFGVDDFIDKIERVKKVRVRVPSFSNERVKNSFSIERVKKARVHVPRFSVDDFMNNIKKVKKA